MAGSLRTQPVHLRTFPSSLSVAVSRNQRKVVVHTSRTMMGPNWRRLSQMLLVACLLIVVSLSTRGPLNVSASLQPHSPIVINGDSGFTSANGVTGGSGTSSDPYIIQGWNLSSTGPGISI